MSRSRLTVILYSAACAEKGSAANEAPGLAVRAVMPIIPKRRRIAYSLWFPNPVPPGAQIAFAKCPGGLDPEITRPQGLRIESLADARQQHLAAAFTSPRLIPDALFQPFDR